MTAHHRVSAALVLILLMAAPAAAQTHRYVSVTGNDLGGANTCFDPQLPCRTVSHALGTAFADDVVHIGGGAYTESITINKSLTLRGAGETITLLQAHAQPDVAEQRVISTEGAIRLTITDLTVRHGRTTVCSSGSAGGGIRAGTGANLTMERVTLADNRSACNGGGLHALAEIHLDMVTFVGNRIGWGYGGGALVGSATIHRSTFVENVSDHDGGGLALSSGSIVEISETTFLRNSAEYAGGAIHSLSSVSIRGSSFRENAVRYPGGVGFAYGGAIVVEDPESDDQFLFIEDSEFLENRGSDYGGAIYSSRVDVRLENALIDGNNARNGGGIRIFNAALEILGGEFRHNSADDGGAIWLRSGLGNPIVDGTTFRQNTASINGGAIHVADGSLSLANALISENSAGTYGAGVYSESADLTVQNSIFSANGVGSRGGGIYALGGSPTLSDVVFHGNTAAENGGGMAASESSPSLTNVAFVGNQATLRGGGMDNAFGGAELINVLFAANVAGSHGGGLSNRLGSPSLLTNVSFAGNRGGGNGGGMHSTSNSPPDVRNALFWQNQDTSGTGTAAASMASSSTSTPTVVSSMAQGCRPGGVWNDNCGANAGGNLSDIDPRFVALPDPGAAPFVTGDLRLRTDSPVIDMGLNAWVEDITSDLEGNDRIIGLAVDPGPCEYTPRLFHDTFEALPMVFAACRFAPVEH